MMIGKEIETHIQTIRIYSQRKRMEFVILKYENSEKKNVERRRNTKGGKNLNILIEGKPQVLGNIGSGNHQTNRDERKKRKKRASKKNEKNSRNQAMQKKFHQRNKLSVPMKETQDYSSNGLKIT